MKKLTHLLTYFILRLMCLILMLLPLQFTYLLARLTGSLLFHIFHFRRRITMDNLEIAFGGEMNKEQLTALACRSYKQIAMTFMELLIGPKLQTKIQQILEPENIRLIQELLKQGQGLVTVSGHLGNWELQGAAAATVLPEPFTVAAVQQSNPYINRFITQRRNGMGMEVAGSKEAMKHLVRALKNHRAVGLVADQNAGGHAVFVDFFGRIAATHPGPAQLALKFKAPMLVGAAIRIGPARFKILIQQVEIKADDTIATLTQRHVKILESFIRQYPDQYLWLHRRWKTRPTGELKI